MKDMETQTATLTLDDRDQSLGEEIANAISHGVGCALSIAAIPILVVAAAREGTAANIVGASIFGSTLVLLYLTSTLYHAMPLGRAKRVFRTLDHAAIFLLIAGSYTPFTLGVLSGAWGWSIFGVVWAFALFGVVLKVVTGSKHKRLSLVLYLGMGWLIVVAAKPLVTLVPFWGLFWLAAGGGAYTLGTVFYATDKRRYHHFIWHLFVLTGSICHFFAALYFAA